MPRKKQLGQPARMDPTKVGHMLAACEEGNIALVKQLLAKNGAVYARQQDETTTGVSPLMVAAAQGHYDLCQLLLENGAPWNAVDKQGRCAGNFATNHQHWRVVDLLVDAGTKAELILGASLRRLQRQQNEEDTMDTNDICADEASLSLLAVARPVEHEPCTKPDYLSHALSYSADGTALLDGDRDAVMMEWERPLMEAHASILLMENNGKRVLNVGFGMGLIDTALQKLQPDLHIIIEAHPDVYSRMLKEGWDKKPNVRICFGKWQDVMPQLIREGVVVDGIFYDTYGEHFMDLEDFHHDMVKLLSQPNGVYSFFNGLAPDNLFFHGVACQCVKLQLGQLGLDVEFLPCEIQVNDNVWEGVRRKYWHGRDTYYLPRATWKTEARQETAPATIHAAVKQKAHGGQDFEQEQENKRQKIESSPKS